MIPFRFCSSLKLLLAAHVDCKKPACGNRLEKALILWGWCHGFQCQRCAELECCLFFPLSYRIYWYTSDLAPKLRSFSVKKEMGWVRVRISTPAQPPRRSRHGWWVFLVDVFWNLLGWPLLHLHPSRDPFLTSTYSFTWLPAGGTICKVKGRISPAPERAFRVIWGKLLASGINADIHLVMSAELFGPFW